MAREKNLQIETLRGLAILLIVLGHVIGSTPDGGMQIDHPSPWRYFYMFSAFIRLPLITAIAGWVYAIKPVSTGNFTRFIKNKFCRLLIPMFVVGFLYFFIQNFTPGTNHTANLKEWWKILIFPYTYFWYLYSLFIIMIIIAIADINNWINTPKKWFIFLFISLLVAATENTIIPYSFPNFFGFKGSLILFPFFLAGVGINRFSPVIFQKKYRILYSLLALIGVTMIQIDWFCFEKSLIVYENLKPLFIIPIIILLIQHMPTVKFFVWIGMYSYTIYLYHGFGTSGGRIILTYLGIENQFIIFIFSSTIALLIPVILEKVILNKWLRFFLFGKKIDK